jgi:cytochrome c oxidase cbb3-type subunit 3
LLLALACNERPNDLREWKPSDHAQEDNPSAAAQQNQVDPTKEAANTIPGLEDVTIVAWQQNCTQCHGQLGRGDGPRGPMLKATNLSDPEWQKAHTDEQIATVIKLGKGLMPSFQQLPDVTIAKLVMLVRMMNVARLQGHAAAAASGSAAPGASGAPAASGTAPRGSATPRASSAPRPPSAASAPASSAAP